MRRRLSETYWTYGLIVEESSMHQEWFEKFLWMWNFFSVAFCHWIHCNCCKPNSCCNLQTFQNHTATLQEVSIEYSKDRFSVEFSFMASVWLTVRCYIVCTVHCTAVLLPVNLGDRLVSAYQCNSEERRWHTVIKMWVSTPNLVSLCIKSVAVSSKQPLGIYDR